MGITGKLYAGLHAFERGFIFTTLVLVFVFVLAAVITRYILHVALPWLGELTQFALIATVFVGAAVVTWQKADIKVDVITPAIHQERVRNIINWSLYALLLVMSGYFAYLSYRYMMDIWAMPGYSSTLRIMHTGWMKSLPFVGSVLWSFELVVILVKDSSNLVKKYH